MEKPKPAMIRLDSLKINPRNPRTISREAFARLCASVKSFPKMLELRPIVIDAGRTIIGGTQRYRALVANGLTEVPAAWIKDGSHLTAAERKRFIVADNAPEGLSGENDWDILSADYDLEELKDWGFDEKELLGLDQKWSGETEKKSEKLSIADIAEDNPKLARFLEARRLSHERGADKGEVNFWVCIVFQSWKQKQEFLAQCQDLPTRYGMYVDGEAFAASVKKSVQLSGQKPIIVPIEKKLSDMVIP